jgi:hypothetical protein
VIITKANKKKKKNEKSHALLFLPPLHSNHNLRSILGIDLHGNNFGDCNSGSLNTSLDISVMLSPLSQRTLARDVCLICVSFAGLKVDGLSYQNLPKIKSFHIVNKY